MVEGSRAGENDKGPGRWDRKWITRQFSIEIFIGKFQDFLNKFQSPLGFRPNAQSLPQGVLISFRIIKDFH